MSIRYLDIYGKGVLALYYHECVSRHFNDDDPLVIVVADFPHGASMDSLDGFYKNLFKQLSKADFSVIGFDYRGFGQSEGDAKDFCCGTAMEDLTAIIKWATQKQGYKNISLVSFGMGCTLAAKIYNPSVFNCMVFGWPVLSPMDTPLKQIEDMDHKKSLADNGYCKIGDDLIGHLFANEIHQMDIKDNLKKLDCPIQIQHGTQDSYSSYTKLHSLLLDIEGVVDFCTFEDGDHYFPDPSMRAQAIQNALFFIKKYRKRLPPLLQKKKLDRTQIFRSQS